MPHDTSESSAGGARLGALVALAALASAVAASALATALHLGFSAYRANMESVERLDRATDVLAAPIAAAVEANDRDAAAMWLRTLEQHPGATAARVALADGGVFAAWGRLELFESAAGEDQSSSSAGALARSWTRLDDERNLGGIDVLYRPRVAAAQPAATVRFAAFAFLAAAAIASSIGLLAARRIARPVEETLDLVRDLGEPSHDRARLPARGAAELREIAGCINQMLDARRSHGAAMDELVAQLRVARDLADAASAAKTRFLAHMSHELRTPLNAIMGYTKFVIEDLAGPEHEQARDDLSRVMRASEHLLSLINQVLDLSKIEAGGLDLELSGFDVGTLVRQVVETSAPLAEKNANTLELHECPRGEVLVSDAMRLRQCLLNVLGNALKFTQGGRIDVRARLVKSGLDRLLTCEIQDTGPGVPPDKIAAIFEPFVQVDDGRGGQRQGTGLGLAITKRLCVAMGGDIVCTSELGRGSIFTITVRDLGGAAARRAA